MADAVAIGLRGLAYAAVLLAAGVPIFRWLVGNGLDRSAAAMRRLGAATAAVALALSVAHALVEPARLTGELGGIFDGSLRAILFASDFGVAASLRIAGIGLIAGGALINGRAGEGAALTGATVAILSFGFMGHTAEDSHRWLLAPLLALHLFGLAFWFGGLLPLRASSRLEIPSVAGAVVERFSRVAIRLVPAIFIAGAVTAGMLLESLASLRTPYGSLLLAKVAGFAILMLLAAANKWRFGPKIATGDAASLAAFRRTVLVEWFLILAVVMITAAMTALYSPLPNALGAG